ncbi:MAG: glycosyltransferase family 2 protein [Candidatus Schekmanbacteria bacterium]|nr:glycosyltransferase family 2 protein [Candidatus Schekmanbacteria bacterium]
MDAPKNLHLSIIMPALNEEKNILAAIDTTLCAFTDFKIDGEVIVVNDGSSDKTPELVNQVLSKDTRVKLINHQTPQGIGASFWDGVDSACGDAVSMFPGDNENDPWETLRYFNLLEHVDIVIPFVYNKEVRPLYRNIISFLYRFIINTTFLVNFNYTNGTILYRRSLLDGLKHRNAGFFYQTDILIRLVKKGYLFAEIPYRLGMRNTGTSKAVSLPSLVKVAKGYLNLVKDYYGQTNIKEDFIHGTLTAERYSKQ